MTRAIPLEVRFWKMVDKSRSDECWVWTGGKRGMGYGVIHKGGSKKVSLVAHRVSYEMHIGPIPKGMQVCHRCDNPSCVNPAHFFLGDSKVNADDRDQKGRHWVRSGAEHYSAILTDKIVCEIRSKYKGKRGEQAALARAYGLDPRHIQKIVNNTIWSKVL